MPLELPLAGVGSRTLAASIDHLLLMLLQTLWLTGALVVAPRLQLSGGWIFALVTLGLFALQWSYFAAFEIALAGQTPGKLAVGLRVVSRHGGRTTAAAILIRNFLRTLDLAFGLPVMAIDRQARRLGDLVAGTLVVHHREERAGTPLGRHPDGWGAREVMVVESFLRRAELLENDSAQGLAEQLLRWIREREPGFWAEVEPGLRASGDPVHTLRQALEAGS